MRCSENGFDYSPHPYQYPPHAAVHRPLQISDDRLSEWDLPRSYPVGFRAVHPEYISRHSLQSQHSSQASFLQSTPDWQKDLQNGAQFNPLKKGEVCVMLMNKVVLCVESEDPVNVSVQELMELILQDNQDLSLPASARDIFAIWLVSPMLELQLTSSQKPYLIRQHWITLLLKYTRSLAKHLDKDEPTLYLRRNVFYNKVDEKRICDTKVLELLYDEAKFNVLQGRYPFEVEDCFTLAGLQARLELGPINPQIHTAEFFRSKISSYLPSYACKTRWPFISVNTKPGPEHKLLDRYRSIPVNTTRYKLLRKYLEFCWALPYYGSAFFTGQIEKPIKGFAALLTHCDKQVLIGISRDGIHIIDSSDSCLLLSIKFQNLAWDYAASTEPENPDCLPCLFIQFKPLNSMTQDSKMMQIFSNQASMMDKLISKFVDELKQVPSRCEDQVDNFAAVHTEDDVIPITLRKLVSKDCIEEKMKRLSLVTCSDSGNIVLPTRSRSFKT